MTTESPDDLDRRTRELDLEKREEELRQLRANARVRWITPAALAALLPLIAGFGLWVVGEVKQYNEGYRALREKAGLEREKEALQTEKARLYQEIQTLLPLKEHYAEEARRLKREVDATQAIMDETYLRTVFLGSETIYALSHVTSLPPGPDGKTLDAIKADVRTLPGDSATRLEDLLFRYGLMDDMVKVSFKTVSSFKQAVNLLPASDWAKRLQPMPSGYFLPGRNIMFSDGPDGRRLYDVTEGRDLTKDEAKGAAK